VNNESGGMLGLIANMASKLLSTTKEKTTSRNNTMKDYNLV
jgi:hypothetical protein